MGSVVLHHMLHWQSGIVGYDKDLSSLMYEKFEIPEISSWKIFDTLVQQLTENEFVKIGRDKIYKKSDTHLRDYSFQNIPTHLEFAIKKNWHLKLDFDIDTDETYRRVIEFMTKTYPKTLRSGLAVVDEYRPIINDMLGLIFTDEKRENVTSQVRGSKGKMYAELYIRELHARDAPYEWEFFNKAMKYLKRRWESLQPVTFVDNVHRFQSHPFYKGDGNWVVLVDEVREAGPNGYSFFFPMNDDTLFSKTLSDFKDLAKGTLEARRFGQIDERFWNNGGGTSLFGRDDEAFYYSTEELELKSAEYDRFVDSITEYL